MSGDLAATDRAASGPAADLTVPDLAALVAARLCHDLISPMGAIGNGVELLQMAGPGAAGAGPELGLVTDSLATALGKLRFFRVAFGPADPRSRLSFDEAAALTSETFGGRFGVAWSGAGALPRPTVRLACLTLLCLEKSLPMGGLVRVTSVESGLDFQVEGRRTAPSAAHWALVTDGVPVADLRPDAVQFALLRRGLEADGHRFSVRFGETSAAARLSMPTSA